MPPNALAMIQRAQNRGSLYVFAITHAIIIIVTSIVGLIIGAVFYGQCAIESNISIYLIVEGVTVTVMYSLMLGTVSKLSNKIALTFP
jgi:hypothetical protein